MRTQIPPKHIRAPPISINITQIPPDNPRTPLRHPQGISREHKTPTDPNRHEQTAPETPIYCQVLFEYVCWCLLASVGVCCCLLASCVLWICLGVSWGCLGVVWGYLSDIYGNWRRSNVFLVSGFSIPAVLSQNTILAQSWKERFFVTWLYWDN